MYLFECVPNHYRLLPPKLTYLLTILDDLSPFLYAPRVMFDFDFSYYYTLLVNNQNESKLNLSLKIFQFQMQSLHRQSYDHR